MHALLVDDDQVFCDLLRTYLGHSEIEVDTVHSGHSAIWACHQFDYDIVLLDIMLPQLDGYEVLAQIRKFSSLPVIMLTAKGDELDRVKGLEAGADDYLAKPFNGRELVARMRALLRRIDPENGHEDNGDLRISAALDSVELDGKQIPLTNVEASTLSTLIEHEGKAVSRDLLYQTVLKRENSPFDRSLDTHICNLRRKLGNRDDGTHRITSVRGVGYRYCP